MVKHGGPPMTLKECMDAEEPQQCRHYTGEVEFSCGHTVAHCEDCPRCEIERLRRELAETRAAVNGPYWLRVKAERDRLRAVIQAAEGLPLGEIYCGLEWLKEARKALRPADNTGGSND